MTLQFSKSASLKSGGGLVTPESSVKVVGMNCDIDGNSKSTHLCPELPSKL